MARRAYLEMGSRGFELLRAAEIGLSLVIVGAVCAAVWLWWEGRILEREAESYEGSTGHARTALGEYVKQAQQAGLDLSDERLSRLDREVAFTNQLVAKHAFSWTRFLTDFERTVPPHVSIASVAVSFRDGVSAIAVTGSAVSVRDLTVLVDRLEAHEAFEQVILDHQRTRDAAPAAADGGAAGALDEGGLVEFSLTVIYQPRP